MARRDDPLTYQGALLLCVVSVCGAESLRAHGLPSPIRLLGFVTAMSLTCAFAWGTLGVRATLRAHLRSERFTLLLSVLDTLALSFFVFGLQWYARAPWLKQYSVWTCLAAVVLGAALHVAVRRHVALVRACTVLFAAGSVGALEYLPLRELLWLRIALILLFLGSSAHGLSEILTWVADHRPSRALLDRSTYLRRAFGTGETVSPYLPVMVVSFALGAALSAFSLLSSGAALRGTIYQHHATAATLQRALVRATGAALRSFARPALDSVPCPANRAPSNSSTTATPALANPPDILLVSILRHGRM